VLSELRIRGLGVIDDAVVPFGPGLTVVTGETGAGKTMVLTGLAMVRGERADPGAVRRGADRAEADAEWRLGVIPAEVAERLDEVGIPVESEGDEAVLLLGRTLAREGRTRATAGGRAVPASVLAEITDSLVAVHGQAEQATLRDPRRQRLLLDRFGGTAVAQARTANAQAYTEWRAVAAALADLTAHRQERERDAALRRHGIEEIAAVAPTPGEDEALKAEAAALAHSTDLVAGVGEAVAALAGDDAGADGGAAESLRRARRLLDRAAGTDARLAETAARLAGLARDLDDVAHELVAYQAGLEADPQRLAAVEDRRALLGALVRRYGPTLADVLAWWQESERVVADVDGADERHAALTARASHLRAEVVRAGGDLTAQRLDAAERFAAAVTVELADLAMPDGQLVVDVTSRKEPEEFGPDGADAVEIRLRPHAGAEARPLARGASGGELSRVMLAIEVVLAGVHATPTFVFDEVDAGIGGRVAVEVGRRLARLARDAQVIVVTHLPQVAAFADAHVVVAKGTDGSVTAASVRPVTGEERVAELVRMLSGLEGSASGAEHAGELLALAAEEARRVRPRADGGTMA
jgi:DNA repair protein RecN (Recombination protein N)